MEMNSHKMGFAQQSECVNVNNVKVHSLVNQTAIFNIFLRDNLYDSNQPELVYGFVWPSYFLKLLFSNWLHMWESSVCHYLLKIAQHLIIIILSLLKRAG